MPISSRTLMLGASLAVIGLVSATVPAGSAEVQDAAVPAASASAASLKARADAAFAAPQGPDVYRSLAGLGDPGVGDSVATFGFVDDPTDVALLRRLFPDVDSEGLPFFEGYQAGACRVQEPLATLKARIAAFGAHGAYVDQWIRVQQAVFSACTDGDRSKADVALPRPMPTEDRGLARLQEMDRAYQGAALLFYEHHPARAAAAFDRIAASRSPERAFARYMATAIRAGTTPGGWGYAPVVPARRSIAKAQAILADPGMAAVHPLAYDLIGWIAVNDQGLAARRVQDRAVLHALEAPLAEITGQAEARRRYANGRYDLRFLFSRFDDAAAFLNGHIPADHTGSRAMAEAARTDPMAAWLVFPVSPFQPEFAYQGLAWATVRPVQGEAKVRAELDRRTRGASDSSNPWVHEALMWSNRYDPRLWSMLDAETERAQAGGEGGPVVAGSLDLFHQTRTALMYGGGGGDGAAFAAVVAHLKSWPDKSESVYGETVRESLRYLMTVGRVDEARRLRDELGLTSQAGSEMARTYGVLDLLLVLAEDEDHLVPLLSPLAYDQAPLLNRLPITELRRLAARDGVPAEDRSTFARTAWARTYALGREVDPELDLLMRKLNADITAHWRSRPGRPIRPDDRLALQDVLATPAMNTLIDEYGRHRRNSPAVLAPGPDVTAIDHNKNDDDDWWCPWRPRSNDQAFNQALEQTLLGRSAGEDWTPAALPSLAIVLHASFLVRATDAAEISALTRIQSAPQLLTERTIDWVKRPRLFESRQGQAEALAAAVQTTHWGCDWAGRHGAYSHAAFLLLHQRFPQTEAARRTRYWYDCNGPCSGRSDALPPAPTIPPRPSGLAALLRRISPF